LAAIFTTKKGPNKKGARFDLKSVPYTSKNMTEDPHIFIQLGLGTALGQAAGLWLHEGDKKPKAIIFVFTAVILLLALSSLGNLVRFVMGVGVVIANIALVLFGYYIKSIDDKRAAKKKAQEAQAISNSSKDTL